MNRFKKSTRLIFIALGILVAVFFILTVFSARQTPAKDPELQKLNFTGEYRYGSGDWEPYSPEVALRTEGRSQVCIRGKFDREIDVNESLLLYVRYLEVVVSKNGEPIFTYGTAGSFPSIMKSAGENWVRLRAEQISDGEIIEIRLENKYQNNYYSAYDDFLVNIYAGDSGVMLNFLIRRGLPFLVGGFFCLALAIPLLIISLALKLKRTNPHPSLFRFFWVMIVSGLWVILSGGYMSLIERNAAVLLVLQTSLLVLSGVFLIAYIETFVKSKWKWFYRAVQLGMLLFLLTSLILQWTGTADAYEMLNYYIPITGVLSIGIYLLVVIELRQAKGFWNKFVFFSVLLFGLFLVGEWLNYELELFPMAGIFGFGLQLFVLLQIFFVANQVILTVTKARRVAEAERELTENRVSMMLSQIRPHFLYNSLLGIRQLCDENPKKASDAIGYFSNYLRGNMDSISNRSLIPFEQELQHVKNYLYLERMRFEDRLNVVFRIEEQDFLLPTLSLQPLVENAVRCGVTQRQEGGTVIVSAVKTASGVVVSVEDDGIGFDATHAACGEKAGYKEEGEAHSHIGIANVRERIERQCGGSLTIESRIGVGTVARIHLPASAAKGEFD